MLRKYIAAATCLFVLLTIPGPKVATAVSPPDLKTLCFHTQWINYADRLDKQTTTYFLREFPRQAMLIAARDELKLPTRDQTLGEKFLPDEPTDHLLVADTATRSNKTLRLRLLKFDFEEAEECTRRPTEKIPVWKNSYSYRPGLAAQQPDLLVAMELASRTDFVEALKSVGYERSDRKIKDIPANVAGSWEERLLEVDMVTQFAVVQECHQAIAASGESEKRLGVLARGYANLCLLTNHQRNALTFAFAARSLLYAQRMAVAGKAEPSEDALWCRAYAWAVTGFHHNALADLAKLKERGAEAKDWKLLIAPYCEFDRPGLTDLASDNNSLQAMALRLEYQLVSVMRYPQWMLDSGLKVIQAAPTSYGVSGDLARYGVNLTAKRTGSRSGPLLFGNFLPASIQRAPMVPESVTKLCAPTPLAKKRLKELIVDPNPTDEFSAAPVGIAMKLNEADKLSTETGLCWSALAYLIEEETYTQVANYFSVAMNATESSHVEEVKSILPLIEGHRFSSYIETYKYNAMQDQPTIKKITQDLKIQDPRNNMDVMFYRLRPVLREREKVGGVPSYLAWDSGNLYQLIDSLTHRSSRKTGNPSFHGRQLGNWIGRIAPNSEIGLRLQVEFAKNPSVEQLKAWDSKLKTDPLAIRLLGQWYLQNDLPEDAIRCFEKSNTLLRNYATCSWLAKTYWDAKQYKKWEDVFVDYLSHEDSSSGHYFTRVALAKGYYSFAEFERARPYALKAADFFGADGLGQASFVEEALGNWERSEFWIKQQSQNYPTLLAFEWYLWCNRTGRGDRRAAWKLAAKHFYSPPADPKRAFEIDSGVFHLLEGRVKESREAYQRSLKLAPTFTATFMVAQLSRRLEDEASRKAVIENFRKHLSSVGEKDISPDVQAAGLAILNLIDSDKPAPAKEKIASALKSVDDPATRCAFTYFAASEFDSLGKSDEAIYFWRKALRMPQRDGIYSTLSGHELSKRFKTSRTDDDQISKEDFWSNQQLEHDWN